MPIRWPSGFSITASGSASWKSWMRSSRKEPARSVPAPPGNTLTGRGAAVRIMHDIHATAFVNWYEVLGVAHDANDEVLKRVFHLVATRFHPDNQASGDLDRFLKVKAAFEVLTDPQRRKAFDEELRIHNKQR